MKSLHDGAELRNSLGFKFDNCLPSYHNGVIINLHKVILGSGLVRELGHDTLIQTGFAHARYASLLGVVPQTGTLGRLNE